MLITREYDYALRIVRNLALTNTQSTVGEICEKEHIPQAYAYKILKKLEKAGMVKSQRGAHGGYRLMQDPNKITLHDVYNAVEGLLYINECMMEGYECPNRTSSSPCLVHEALWEIQANLIADLQRQSLAEILNPDTIKQP